MLITLPRPTANNYSFVEIIDDRCDSVECNDDDVRRVCKTPGDPCGCTRQYYQRSGLPFSVIHWYLLFTVILDASKFKFQ